MEEEEEEEGVEEELYNKFTVQNPNVADSTTMASAATWKLQQSQVTAV